MALPRLLRRSVELGGEVLEEFDPVAVSLLSLLFAEPDDHQVLLRSYVDVLPVFAASREVVLTVGCVYPPEILVALGRIGAPIRARGLFYPPLGDELLTLPVPLLGEQHAEPPKVARPRVDPALHLLEAALCAVSRLQEPSASTPIGFHGFSCRR